MARILIVDDIENNRDLLAKRLTSRFELGFAVDGLDAVQKMDEEDYDLVLLDIQMPRMDGFATLQHMAEDRRLRHIPVVVISAMGEMDNVARCIELGADDYLSKPFNNVLLNARINACIEKKRLHDQEERLLEIIQHDNELLEQRVQEQVSEIVSSHHSVILAMSKLAESKDPETGAHLERLRAYCKCMAQVMREQAEFINDVDDDFVENIYAASPLHDIGKVGVPDEVLLKPGKLTDAEWQQMQMHTTIGAETLIEVDRLHPGNDFVKMGIQIASAHHEKWDGSGYPLGLKGDEIPLAARVLALADVYDALRSQRCYKEAFSHERSRSIIVDGKGMHFDPKLVDVFLLVEDDFLRIRDEFDDDGA
jgi:putative two-component system response regulator